MEIKKIWFSIGEVSKLSLIPIYKIRYLTNKYGIPCRKNQHGDRKYHRKIVFEYFINGN